MSSQNPCKQSSSTSTKVADIHRIQLILYTNHTEYAAMHSILTDHNQPYQAVKLTAKLEAMWFYIVL